MDEIRKVAKAYYNGAAGSEKELARQLFRSLDSNGDGKVSLREYKKMVKPSFSSIDLFKQLDANCDGTLDFDEVLALNYMDKVSMPRCNACDSLLLASYFSCLPCQPDDSFYLCCNCYAGGEFKHRHSSNYFVDTRAMLKLLDHLLKQAKITTHQIHHLQGGEGVEKLADIVIQGLALEEEAEEDDEEEDEDDEEDDKEVVDEVDDLNRGANLVNYGKAVYKSQPESKNSNESNKKTKKIEKAGKQSKLRGRSKREKVAGAIEAMNNKIDSLKEKKKKVKTVISVGTAVVNIGGKAVASTLFHHVVHRKRLALF